MAETTARRDAVTADEQTLAHFARVEVRCQPSGSIVLLDPRDQRSRVAAGALLELCEGMTSKRTRVVRLQGEGDDGERGETTWVRDDRGEGVQNRRTFALASSLLKAVWTVTAYKQSPLLRITLTVRNEGTEPVVVRRLFPFVAGVWWDRETLRVGGRERGFSVYKNGWQSWSFAGGLPLGRADPRPRVPTNVAWHSPGGVNPRQPGGDAVDVVSEEMGMLGHVGQSQALLAGFLTADRWLGQVYAQRREAAFAAATLLDDYALQPGEAVSSPPLAVGLGRQDELLEAYGAAVAEAGRARPTVSTPTGWCSWYYYFTGVTEADVLENLARARALRVRLPFDVIQIDDGYQAAIGDWLSVNEKFPHGMKFLADRIREAGFRPGLWLAPFTVAANSRLAREHPDWLIHDDQGRPSFGGHNWDTDLHGLDTSHPGAREWLRTLLRVIVNEWGFDYLKLDFLVSGALAGQRHHPRATRASALREGLALIRETVGDDVFILGCGCPLLSAVGIVDAMRIGPDSAPYWGQRFAGVPIPYTEGHPLPALEGAIRNTLARAWMHRALWANDPDCLIVRERDSGLSLDEIRAFATAVGLSGGMVLASDRLAELSAKRIDLITRLLPPLPDARAMSEVFAYGIPERVMVPIERRWGSWLLVGLFNGTNEEREMAVGWSEAGLEAGAYHAVEFWSGAYLGRSDRGVRVRVAEHGAAALAVRRERDEPQLLSTSFHISQGGVEIADWSYDQSAAMVRWRAALGREATGSFTLWLPDGLYPRALTSTAQGVSWRREATGEIVVSAQVRDEATFALELERRA